MHGAGGRRPEWDPGFSLRPANEEKLKRKEGLINKPVYLVSPLVLKHMMRRQKLEPYELLKENPGEEPEMHEKAAEDNAAALRPQNGTTAVATDGILIGRTLASRQPIVLGESERTGGVYIIGKPRMGKSSLLISMALQDMQRGHGFVFIDPHEDAISELLSRLPKYREQDVILLDPRDKTHVFGINPLECENPNDWDEREDAFNQVKALFTKLFADPQGNLGLLFTEYLENSVYALIETPGTTLLDIPRFLEDSRFREEILNNVKITKEVIQFWEQQLHRKNASAQEEEVQPTLRRVRPFLRHHIIRDVVGQKKSTINFHQIINQGKIVLLRMQTWLEEDQKHFFGTLIISELTRAAFARSRIEREARTPFALYCDEFQEFSTPDFARLFSQTGKFMIMPTVAHQGRWQFKMGDTSRDATLNAPNKIAFSLNPADAKELAAEFAELPSAPETALDRMAPLSRQPVSDLLRYVHPNEFIAGFVERYLRRLPEQMEDIEADQNESRILRNLYLDTAGLYRTEERITGMPRDPMGMLYSARTSDLSAAKHWQLKAIEQDHKQLRQHQLWNGLRLSLRELNAFLVPIQEGRNGPGTEAFWQFLERHAPTGVYGQIKEIYKLYLQVLYGDPQVVRSVPYEFAFRHELFASEVSRIQKVAIQTYLQERNKRVTEWREHNTGRADKFLSYEAEERTNWRKSVAGKILRDSSWYTKSGYNLWKSDTIDIFEFTPKFFEFIKFYLLILEYPKLKETLTPIFRARFGSRFEHCKTIEEKLQKQLNLMLAYQRRFADVKAEIIIPFFKKRLPRYIRQRFGAADCYMFFKEEVLTEFGRFLDTFGEGAVASLCVLACAYDVEQMGWYNWRGKDYELDRSVHRWLKSGRGRAVKIDNSDGALMGEEYTEYPGFSMQGLPAFSTHDPLQVCEIIEQVCELLPACKIQPNLSRYYWVQSGEDPYVAGVETRFAVLQDEDVRPAGPSPWRWLVQGRTYFYGNVEYILFRERQETRPHINMSGLLGQRHDVLGFARKDGSLPENFLPAKTSIRSQWQSLSMVAKQYLLNRAIDIAIWGQEAADITFPAPTLHAAASQELEAHLVSAWRNQEATSRFFLVQKWHGWAENIVSELYEEHYKESDEVSRRVSNQINLITHKEFRWLPEYLEKRVLSDEERQQVLEKCDEELTASIENFAGVKQVLSEFVEFCALLGRPENRVDGSFGRKQQPRLTRDLRDEMEGLLANLDERVAFAKVLLRLEGRRVTRSAKIQAPTLEIRTDPQEDMFFDWFRKLRSTKEVEQIVIQNALESGFVRPRSAVVKEIEDRQTQVTPPKQEKRPGKPQTKGNSEGPPDPWS